VRAMSSAEGIIDVVLSQTRQLLGKLFVIRLFFRVEAKILQQQGLTLLELSRHFFCFGAYALRTETHIFSARQFAVQQHAQPLGYGLKTHFRIVLTLWTSQVRGEDQTCAVAQCILDSRQGFTNASVVHDAPIIERYVEINSHEDAMIV